VNIPGFDTNRRLAASFGFVVVCAIALCSAGCVHYESAQLERRVTLEVHKPESAVGKVSVAPGGSGAFSLFGLPLIPFITFIPVWSTIDYEPLSLYRYGSSACPTVLSGNGRPYPPTSIEKDDFDSIFHSPQWGVHCIYGALTPHDGDSVLVVMDSVKMAMHFYKKVEWFYSPGGWERSRFL